MRLFEEYLHRHNLHDVHVVHHCSAASLVLNTRESDLWSALLNKDFSGLMPPYAVLNVRWEHNDHHPGHYEINISYPIHDGYKANLFCTSSIASIKWHEYESYILALCDRLNGFEVVRDHRLISLAAWEMFVYSYDNWFLNQGGDIKYLLFESLDKENSFEKRLGCCHELIKKLSMTHNSVVRAWKFDVCGKINNHADWLANLIEQKCQKNILLLK